MKTKDTLPDIRIATPCKADWNQMAGDDYMRHCKLCNLNVYNISELSAKEIRSLVERKEGRLCVRLYRRKDGTILTQDCPVGLRWVKRKVALMGAAVATFLLHAGGGTGLIARALTWFRGASAPQPAAISAPVAAPPAPEVSEPHRVRMGRMKAIPRCGNEPKAPRPSPRPGPGAVLTGSPELQPPTPGNRVRIEPPATSTPEPEGFRMGEPALIEVEGGNSPIKPNEEYEMGKFLRPEPEAAPSPSK